MQLRVKTFGSIHLILENIYCINEVLGIMMYEPAKCLFFYLCLIDIILLFFSLFQNIIGKQ